MNASHTYNRLAIDVGAVQKNYQFIKQKVGPQCQVAAMVKADAYGLGMETIVPALMSAGADFFYVSNPEEGVIVRQLTHHPIAVLGGMLSSDQQDYRAYHLIPVLNTIDQILDCPGDLLSIWHLDTGMNRLGIYKTELDQAVRHECQRPMMLMTHLTSADDVKCPHSQKQVSSFDSARAHLPPIYHQIPVSICNSSGIFRDQKWHRHQVRPGLALYGGNPTPENHNPMKPVIRWETRILQTHEVQAGETVGYNQTCQLTQTTLLATVGVGYADGFLRAGSQRASLYWRGHRCRIMGRISMDLITIEINLPNGVQPPNRGDWVEVIGQHQSVDDLAQDLGTISYEVLTSIKKLRASREIITD